MIGRDAVQAAIASLIVERSGLLVDVEFMRCLGSVLPLVVCELLSELVGAQQVLPTATSAVNLCLGLLASCVGCSLRIQLFLQL